MDSNIKQLIETIRIRTPMYIGGSTITSLKAFIDGWAFRTMGKFDDAYLMNEFQEWIQSKYNIKASKSWASIILFYSQDEHDALDKFFELWDEFLAEKNN